MLNHLSFDVARLKAEELRGAPNRPELRAKLELDRARKPSRGGRRRSVADTLAS
jgi:hypothetical protein